MGTLPDCSPVPAPQPYSRSGSKAGRCAGWKEAAEGDGSWGNSREVDRIGSCIVGSFQWVMAAPTRLDRWSSRAWIPGAPARHKQKCIATDHFQRRIQEMSGRARHPSTRRPQARYSVMLGRPRARGPWSPGDDDRRAAAAGATVVAARTASGYRERRGKGGATACWCDGRGGEMKRSLAAPDLMSKRTQASCFGPSLEVKVNRRNVVSLFRGGRIRIQHCHTTRSHACRACRVQRRPCPIVLEIDRQTTSDPWLTDDHPRAEAASTSSARATWHGA